VREDIRCGLEELASSGKVAFASAIERASWVSSSCCVRSFKCRFNNMTKLMQAHT
jgi:hypothetical protein